MKTKAKRYKAGANSQIYGMFTPINVYHPKERFKKYEHFGLESLLRRKAWLENIIFTQRINEHSSRKQACLFLDYQELKKALKRKEMEME